MKSEYLLEYTNFHDLLYQIILSSTHLKKEFQTIERKREIKYTSFVNKYRWQSKMIHRIEQNK